MTPALTDNRQRHVARSSQDSFELDFETLQGMLDQELQVRLKLSFSGLVVSSPSPSEA